MFWGLIMEPQKRYSQQIRKAFHISMASLDISKSTDGQPSQVMCGFEGRNYLLCTLESPDKLQCPLDLYFEEGTSVSFATNGQSNVHLTGYLTKELDEVDEESDQETQEFEVMARKNPRTTNKTDKEPLKKKPKTILEVEEEEDSDDSDVDIEKLMNESDGEDLSEEDSGEEGDEEEDVVMEHLEEEEDSDDDDDDDDEEDEEEEEEEQEEEEEDEKQVTKVTMNGVEKKSKKGKNAPQLTPKKDQQKTKEASTHKSTPAAKGKKLENGDTKKEKKPKEEKKKNATPKKKTLAGGVIIEELKEGDGAAAGNGKFVHVYYEGRLKTNNKVFDKTLQGPGFGFRLGKGEVIKGWDIGVSGMKVGGKRRIICPPNSAYGAKGSPPVIPPNSTLVFEVELKKVK